MRKSTKMSILKENAEVSTEEEKGKPGFEVTFALVGLLVVVYIEEGIIL